MIKPLKDWTLGEVHEECKRRDAPCASSGCQFYEKQGLSHCCKLQDLPPEAWELSNTPELTPDELAVLRMVKANGYQKVFRVSIAVWAKAYASQLQIPVWLLPSLRPGDELDLTTMDLGEEQ